MSFQEHAFYSPEANQENPYAYLAGVASPKFDESLCRMCGKRQSPSSSRLGISSNTFDSALEPRSKKQMVCGNQYLSDAGLAGFTEIKLPAGMNPAPMPTKTTSPVLRRCVSDPLNSPGDGSNVNAGVNRGLEYDGPMRRCVSDPYQAPGAMERNEQAEREPIRSPVTGMTVSPASGGLPPLYPGTSRLASEVTPPKAPVDSVKGQSPDSLRLKRMRERLKEMSKWWVDVVREGDEIPEEQNHPNPAAAGGAATASEDVGNKEREELVSVERMGDGGLKIKLGCPCGSGFQILIIGDSCYYKLL